MIMAAPVMAGPQDNPPDPKQPFYASLHESQVFKLCATFVWKGPNGAPQMLFPKTGYCGDDISDLGGNPFRNDLYFATFKCLPQIVTVMAPLLNMSTQEVKHVSEGVYEPADVAADRLSLLENGTYFPVADLAASAESLGIIGLHIVPFPLRDDLNADERRAVTQAMVAISFEEFRARMEAFLKVFKKTVAAQGFPPTAAEAKAFLYEMLRLNDLWDLGADAEPCMLGRRLSCAVPENLVSTVLKLDAGERIAAAQGMMPMLLDLLEEKALNALNRPPVSVADACHAWMKKDELESELRCGFNALGIFNKNRHWMTKDRQGALAAYCKKRAEATEDEGAASKAGAAAAAKPLPFSMDRSLPALHAQLKQALGNLSITTPLQLMHIDRQLKRLFAENGGTVVCSIEQAEAFGMRYQRPIYLGTAYSAAGVFCCPDHPSNDLQVGGACRVVGFKGADMAYRPGQHQILVINMTDHTRIDGSFSCSHSSFRVDTRGARALTDLTGTSAVISVEGFFRLLDHWKNELAKDPEAFEKAIGLKEDNAPQPPQSFFYLPPACVEYVDAAQGYGPWVRVGDAWRRLSDVYPDGNAPQFEQNMNPCTPEEAPCRELYQALEGARDAALAQDDQPKADLLDAQISAMMHTAFEARIFYGTFKSLLGHNPADPKSSALEAFKALFGQGAPKKVARPKKAHQ